MDKKLLGNKNLNIVLVLVVSFVLTRLITEQVFLASTPRINPRFISRLKNLPQFIANLPSRLTKKTQPATDYSLSDIVNTPIKKVSQGVYAGEQGQIKLYKVSESEVDWEQIELQTKSGRTIVLRYPKGQPPTQEMLDIIKSE